MIFALHPTHAVGMGFLHASVALFGDEFPPPRSAAVVTDDDPGGHISTAPRGPGRIVIDREIGAVALLMGHHGGVDL